MQPLLTAEEKHLPDHLLEGQYHEAELPMLNQIEILGVPVSLVDMDRAVAHVLQMVSEQKSNLVCIRDVHGLMKSVEDPEMMSVQQIASMVTPDGMPLVWISRFRTRANTGRVCGADFVDALCERGQDYGIRHFFYGGKPGVVEKMTAKLSKKYPRLEIVGTYSPPFRALTPEEDAQVVRQITGSAAQIVWVGISTPKQEFWMRDHVHRLNGATLIGVGAAFDFHAGEVARAPVWMQRAGLEWLHRLASEPRRLWRRYLILCPKFVVYVLCEQVKLSLRPLITRAKTRASR